MPVSNDLSISNMVRKKKEEIKEIKPDLKDRLKYYENKFGISYNLKK